MSEFSEEREVTMDQTMTADSRERTAANGQPARSVTPVCRAAQKQVLNGFIGENNPMMRLELDRVFNTDLQRMAIWPAHN